MRAADNKKTAQVRHAAKVTPRSRQQSGLIGRAPRTDQSLDGSGLNGQPLALKISKIDEDAMQPRTNDNPGFSEERLEELAASIRLRGVKTPISVRESPSAPGRFLINHGARRFRASKRAGKTTIPGFIDNDYNEADQVVENLQRNELTPREIADYIGRELAKGIRKGEIASAISKSPAFVSQHVTLLDLPDPIARAFSSGRVRDVTLINELVTVFKKNAPQIHEWLADESQEITRGSVRLLRAFLEDRSRQDQEVEDHREWLDNQRVGKESLAEAQSGQQRTQVLKKLLVQVRHNRRAARLLLSRRPSAIGFAWLKYEDNNEEVEVNLTQVRLVALREA